MENSVLDIHAPCLQFDLTTHSLPPKALPIPQNSLAIVRSYTELSLKEYRS